MHTGLIQGIMTGIDYKQWNFGLCRKPIFEDMIAPLVPSLPPLGAGVNVMPRFYLYKNLSAFFVNR
jgi:hypothetical protein